MPGLPFHRRQGQQDESARRRRQEAQRRRDPGSGSSLPRRCRRSQIHQEAADAGQVRQAAGRRHRRARRLHAEPEVAGGVTTARGARPASARDRRRAHRHGIGGRVHRADDRGARRGCSTNPYAGLVVFVAIPALFVLGLLLIPLGMRLQRRRLRARSRRGRANGRSSISVARRCAGRRSLITALTAVNVVIVLLAGYGSLHWMESPTFCGQVCHTPMQPAVHRVAGRDRTRASPCVTCHIGEGAAGFVHAKLSGVRQLVHVATSSCPEADPAGRRDAAGRAGANLHRLPPARAHRSAIKSA